MIVVSRWVLGCTSTV